jgi:hypothetical protein
MKKILLLLLLVPILSFSQRVVGNNTKPTKSDVIAFMSEIYHTHYIYVADFINVVGTAGVADDVISTVSGTGTSNNLTATTSGRVGLVRSTTGTTNTGRAAVSSAQNILRIGDGSWVYETALNVTTLSTSTEGFAVATGFIDVITAMNQVDGVYFLYDERGSSTGSAASANWQCVTTSNSTRTFTTTSTAVGANAWVVLRIEVNAAGTSAVFKIDGTTVATHTTNIPTGGGRETGFGWLIMKSVGTTARTMDVDYLSAICALTTAR